jgi:enamine deaminase RidA (YjgF/YER057c/UK114 family)
MSASGNRAAPSHYVTPFTIYNGIVFVSGKLPRIGSEIQYRGNVGAEVDLHAAKSGREDVRQRLHSYTRTRAQQESAYQSDTQGHGFVASAPDFTAQGEVIDAASEVFIEAFGPTARRARSAVGVARLPRGASVEIELVVALAPPP